MLLDDRVDWVMKRKLLTMFKESEGIDWQDDMMHSLDLEYHNINPASGLYYGLVEAGQVHRVLDEDRIEAARTEPPVDTRAAARGQVIRQLIDRRAKKYVIDWDSIYLDRERCLDLRNPFNCYEQEAEKF